MLSSAARASRRSCAAEVQVPLGPDPLPASLPFRTARAATGNRVSGFLSLQRRYFPGEGVHRFRLLRLRDLPAEEGGAIHRLMDCTRDPTVMRRAQVVLHSNQGISPPKIASMVFWSEE